MKAKVKDVIVNLSEAAAVLVQMFRISHLLSFPNEFTYTYLYCFPKNRLGDDSGTAELKIPEHSYAITLGMAR
jgi:hypothetical protein